MRKENITFTFASSEVNKFGQIFIKITELCTGKLKLKSLYDQYLKENNPSENFWQDALKKLQLNIVTNFHSKSGIPSSGRLIVIANHAFGVADGVTMCSLISKVRHGHGRLKLVGPFLITSIPVAYIAGSLNLNELHWISLNSTEFQ